MEYKSSSEYVEEVFEYFKKYRDCLMIVSTGSFTEEIKDVEVLFGDTYMNLRRESVLLEFMYKGSHICIEVSPSGKLGHHGEPLVIINKDIEATNTNFVYRVLDILRREIEEIDKITLNTNFTWK